MPPTLSASITSGCSKSFGKVASTGLLIKSEIQRPKRILHKLYPICFTAIDRKTFIQIRITVSQDLLTTHSNTLPPGAPSCPLNFHPPLHHSQRILEWVSDQVDRASRVGVEWLWPENCILLSVFSPASLSSWLRCGKRGQECQQKALPCLTPATSA